MQILAISSHAETGKTTTVKNLCKILFVEAEKRNYSVSEYSHGSLDIVQISDLNLIVAFGKDGDEESQVRENCTFATEIKADILILTTRTKGKGVDYLYSFAKDTYDIVKIGTIEKYFNLQSKFFATESDIAEINQIQTENIWNLLFYILQINYNFNKCNKCNK